MNIINLDAETMEVGKAAFNQYRAAMICGRLTAIYSEGMTRQTGLGVVPGAIAACIEQGMVGKYEILHAVARVSRCTLFTVARVLHMLCGTDPDRHFWSKDRRGNYQTLSGSRANVLLAA